MLDTKKPKLPTPVRLGDLPEWRQGLDKERELAKEAAAIEAQIQGLDGEPTQQRIKRLVNKLLATGDDPPPPEISEAERTALVERREACRQAIQQHRLAMQRLRGQLASQIYKSYEVEHLEKRRAIVRNVAALLQSWQELRAFVDHVVDVGALVDGREASTFNMESCPTLLHLLKTVRITAFVQDNKDLLV